MKSETVLEFIIYGTLFERNNLAIEKESLTILNLKKPKAENIVEERDSIAISSIEREPLQTEYIEELFIEKIYKLEK